MLLLLAALLLGATLVKVLILFPLSLMDALGQLPMGLLGIGVILFGVWCLGD